MWNGKATKHGDIPIEVFKALATDRIQVWIGFWRFVTSVGKKIIPSDPVNGPQLQSLRSSRPLTRTPTVQYVSKALRTSFFLRS